MADNNISDDIKNIINEVTNNTQNLSAEELENFYGESGSLNNNDSKPSISPSNPPSYALYSTKPTNPIDGEIMQPVYATKPTYPVDINITYSQLEENISLLKNSISSLKSSWNDGTKKNLDTLNNSWVGEECAEYTEKLSRMDKKVQNTILALELLCKAYEQTRDMLKDSQTNVVNSIRNID